MDSNNLDITSVFDTLFVNSEKICQSDSNVVNSNFSILTQTSGNYISRSDVQFTLSTDFAASDDVEPVENGLAYL
jgi:hypothetical protein